MKNESDYQRLRAAKMKALRPAAEEVFEHIRPVLEAQERHRQTNAWLDEAISFNVNRGLIHEDRWTDLKQAISAHIAANYVPKGDHVPRVVYDSYADDFQFSCSCYKKQEIKNGYRKVSWSLGEDGGVILLEVKQLHTEPTLFTEAQLQERVAAERASASNYGRLASLADLLVWLNLHDIEDVTMVQDYVQHVTKSIEQSPNQQHVPHPELVALTQQGEKKV